MNKVRKVTNELYSNEVCRICCEFVAKHGRLPKSNSGDQHERQLASWINARRAAMDKKNGLVFYESDREIASGWGVPNMFNRVRAARKASPQKHRAAIRQILEKNRPAGRRPKSAYESRSNEMCRLACQFVLDKGRLPFKNEEGCGKIRSWFRSRMAAKKAGRFYDSDQRVAESMGVPNLFGMAITDIRVGKCAVKSSEKIKDLIRFVLQNRRVPRTTGDEQERQLQILMNMKSLGRRNKNGLKFYKADQKMADEAGMPTLFHRMPSVAKVRSIVKFINATGREPDVNSPSRHERELAKVLVRQRRLRTGKRIVFDQLFELSRRLGKPDLFGSTMAFTGR